MLSAAIMAATTVFAQDTGGASNNAVCVTLKTGVKEYVAFTQQPVIKTVDDKLVVLSASDNKQLVLAEISNLESISAANHDFTAVSPVTVDGNKVTEIFNIDGTKATQIVPGRIYIIKSNGKTKTILK